MIINNHFVFLLLKMRNPLAGLLVKVFPGYRKLPNGATQYQGSTSRVAYLPNSTGSRQGYRSCLARYRHGKLQHGKRTHTDATCLKLPSCALVCPQRMPELWLGRHPPLSHLSTRTKALLSFLCLSTTGVGQTLER